MTLAVDWNVNHQLKKKKRKKKRYSVLAILFTFPNSGTATFHQSTEYSVALKKQCSSTAFRHESPEIYDHYFTAQSRNKTVDLLTFLKGLPVLKNDCSIHKFKMTLMSIVFFFN